MVLDGNLSETPTVQNCHNVIKTRESATARFDSILTGGTDDATPLKADLSCGRLKYCDWTVRAWKPIATPT